MSKTLSALLLSILSEHPAIKTTKHELAETRNRLIEQIKLIDAEIEQLKNEPWSPEEGEFVYMLAPGATPPVIATSFDPSVPFHASNLALGHVFKTEDEATSIWNGKVVDQALRCHPDRVRIEDMELATDYFGLIHDEEHNYVYTHAVDNPDDARRCLGGIVLSDSDELSEFIATFGQEALRAFAAYCAR